MSVSLNVLTYLCDSSLDFKVTSFVLTTQFSFSLRSRLTFWATLKLLTSDALCFVSASMGSCGLKSCGMRSCCLGSCGLGSCDLGFCGHTRDMAVTMNSRAPAQAPGPCSRYWEHNKIQMSDMNARWVRLTANRIHLKCMLSVHLYRPRQTKM